MVVSSLQDVKYPEIWEKLRPYQVEATSRMIDEKRHLNYADMGMGKSLMTLLAVMELGAFPCMIVCSKSAMYVLEDELKKWFDEEAIVYAGKPKKREEAFKQFATEGKKFIITNFSLSEELGIRFGIIPGKKSDGPSTSGGKASLSPTPGTKWKMGALVSDEIQLGGLFNHKTKTYKVFAKLAKAIPHVFLLTGTPYRRGAVDFFGPLSLVAPDRFDSYWSYIGRYCRTIDTGFGKSIERNPKDVVGFRKMLREYASILKKEDHLKDMPPKQRVMLPVHMDDEQERIYKDLVEELFAMTDTGELIMTPGILSQSVRLRQLLACPQELGLKTRGAAIEMILEKSEEIVDANRPFVIFTPFRKAVPYLTEAIREKYGAIKIHTITGGLTPEEFAGQWQGFQNGGGSSVLICVIKSGASFHATRADTAFFLGYEYDFNQNTQAEDRLYRIGQTRPVTCYYLMHKGTIDDEVVQILNDKKRGADLVLSDEAMFKRLVAKRGEK
jgi:SNF2 family DNA or RNA helicase